MKKILILAFICTISQYASADTCTYYAAGQDMCGEDTGGGTSIGCTRGTTYAYKPSRGGTICITDCNTCSSSFERVQRTDSTCDNVTFYVCEPTCPSECPSTTWTSAGTGYEKMCSKGTSAATCMYRCTAGYYGNPTSATSGCTSCASATGNTNATSVAGANTAITGCYVPAGKSFSDTAGSGTYTSNCYWVQ